MNGRIAKCLSYLNFVHDQFRHAKKRLQLGAYQRNRTSDDLREFKYLFQS